MHVLKQMPFTCIPVPGSKTDTLSCEFCLLVSDQMEQFLSYVQQWMLLATQF